MSLSFRRKFVSQSIGHLKLSASLLAALAVSSADTVAFADSVNWSGPANGDWSDDANWNWDGHAPNAGDMARVDSANPVIVGTGVSAATGRLEVGVTATSNVTVNGGLNSSEASLGYNQGASGTLVISGASASWINAGALAVGEAGQGFVTLSDGAGGTITGIAYLGVAPGGVGTLTLNDESTLDTQSDFYVGYGGNGGTPSLDGGSGTVTINSGTLTSVDVFLADGLNTAGNVTVTGAESSWVMSGALSVGSGGVGTLTIADGGSVEAVSAGVGGLASSDTSFVNISGAGSKFTTLQHFNIGSEGAATVTLSDGASITNGAVTIGAHSISSATASGEDSSWTMGDLTVGGNPDSASGAAGNGSFTLNTQAFASSLSAVLGYWDGSNGTVLVDGVGTEWSIGAGRLTVGYHGAGNLTAENGAVISSTGTIIGSQSTGSGTVTVAGGAELTNTGNVYVGNAGSGSLTIQSGGRVTAVDAYVATSGADASDVTVSGVQSIWDMSGVFIAGHESGTEATVVISDGGAIRAVQGTLGNLAGSYGEMTVSGAGSRWIAYDDNVTNWAAFMNVGLSGEGDLSVVDGGAVEAWRLYIGNEAGSFGTVSVTGVGARVATEDRLYVGANGDGVLTVANGAEVSASRINVGYLDGASGVLNIGAEAGQAAVAAGAIQTSELYLGAGAATLVFNHTDADYELAAIISGDGEVVFESGTTSLTGDNSYTGTTLIRGGRLIGTVGSFGDSVIENDAELQIGGAGSFENAISGTGILQKVGDGALVLTASNSFTGTTFVTDGLLTVNGALPGMVSVAEGATLGGAGLVGTTVIDGTLAPGNSPGTLAVAGNVTFNPGSTYDFEVDHDTDASDLIAATGMALLNGGTVSYIGMGSVPRYGQSYTILTAEQGVAGTFSGASSSLVFLRPILSYGENSVTLTLERNGTRFVDLAQTPNQRAVALAAENQDASIFDDLLALEGGGRSAAAVFDSLTGEGHASLRSGLIELGSQVRQMPIDRLRRAFAGPVAVSSSNGAALAYTADGVHSVTPFSDRVGWGELYGSWGKVEGDGNAATFRRETGGLVAGLDMMAMETARLGVFAGYSQSDFKARERLYAANVDSFHLGAYGGTKLSDVALRGGVSYSFHQVDSRRSADLPGGVQAISAAYDAGTFEAFGEIGYGLETPFAAIEPFAGVAYVSTHDDGFVETGGSAALTVASETDETIFSTIGLRASRDIAVQTMPVTLIGMLGWRYAFGDVEPTAHMSFTGSDAFIVLGVPVAEDMAVFELGFDAAINDAVKLGVAYAGQFGDDAAEQSVNLSMKIAF